MTAGAGRPTPDSREYDIGERELGRRGEGESALVCMQSEAALVDH